MRTRNHDSMLWAASRLHRVLAQRARDRQRGGEQFHAAVQSLVRHQAEINRRWGRACKASLHGWPMAAAAERRMIAELVQSSHYYVNEVLRHQPTDAAVAPVTLCQILDELRQLEDEFGQLTITPRRGLVSVVTKPVTLHGIALGRFQLELYVDRLADRQDASAVDCVALDPNPAATSEDTTHPHVRDNVLCAGDATIPIVSALGAALDDRPRA